MNLFVGVGTVSLRLAAFTDELRYRDLAEKSLGLASDFVSR